MNLKKFDIKNLPYMGATVQAGLFALAGYHYFQLGPWGAVVGFGVGAVVNISLAVASSRISDIAQKRLPLARISLFGMFLLSPVTITLSLFAPSSVFTSIAWAASPDLAIVLAGAIAGKSLVSHGEENKPPKPAERPAKPRSAKKQSLSKPLSDIPCRFAGAGCDRTFASQNAANAHARTCEYKPTVSMPVEISQRKADR